MTRKLTNIAIAALLAAGMATGTREGLANTFFTTQAAPATGTFEWDVFSGAYAGPHNPDVAGSSSGAALTAGFFPAPPPPKFPESQIAGGSLYSGGYNGRFGVNLTGASTTGALTTVVLQIAFPSTDPPLPERLVELSTLKLGGTLPTELVDRGIGPDGEHYLWAEWQGLAAASSYSIGFDSNLNHFALDGAKLEYFNGDLVFDAVNASVIPEPSTIALAVLGLGGFAMRKRRLKE